ncbi:hypothetical protein JOF53_004243 [Crossiella equi]|uniref:Uncharacterized protein n=1 Tax=Crossiella equi TaxID=130796 RepID=A0ABS5AG96_9PSEU|nr:hypothetical protein [Crossiella equi]MBP2475371.1 hypothetical protein [Crossiella equi]
MSQLTPGAVLFELPDGGTVLRSPAGEVLGVELPEEALTAVRATLTTGDGEPEALAAFAEAGFLGRRRGWPRERALVGLLGEPHLTGPYAELLAEHGAEPRFVTSPEPGLTAVCALADGPAPEWWTGLDDLPAQGVAWQRVSREGRHALLEPVAAKATDVRHRDVRLRRLAAAQSGHRHLAAYWAGHEVITGEERFTAADLRLVLAHAALDLRVWALGDQPREDGPLISGALPANRRLRVLDLDTGAVADHPVLPVPECAA